MRAYPLESYFAQTMHHEHINAQLKVQHDSHLARPFEKNIIQHMATTEYRQFRAYLDQGDLRQAIQLAEIQSMSGPGNSEFWLTQLATALTRAKKYQEAVDAATRALASAPRAPWALLARATALRNQRNFKAALDDFREALAAGESRLEQRARTGCLECLAGMQRWDELLEQANEWLPGQDGYEWRARAYTGLGRNNEAVEEYRKWLQECPDNRNALWGLTELEIQREGLEPVISRLRRIARIPSRPQIYREIHASLLRRAGREDEAIKEYRNLLSSSGDIKAIRKQAFILAKSGRENEALPLLEEFLRIDPADPYAHASYIAASKRINEEKRARGFYFGLLQQHPDQKHLYGKIRRLGKKPDRS